MIHARFTRSFSLVSWFVGILALNKAMGSRRELDDTLCDS